MSTPQKPEPELVNVFDTQQESEAWVVQSLLESAGIAAIVTSLQAPQDILPGVGGVVVRVNAGQAEEARAMIEDYKNAPNIEPDEDSEPTTE